MRTRFWTILLSSLIFTLMGCPPSICEYREDGDCDDGRARADTSLCEYGTDDVDCLYSCDFENDGDCDDGGPGSDTSLCPGGTDANDCGGL